MRRENRPKFSPDGAVLGAAIRLSKNVPAAGRFGKVGDASSGVGRLVMQARSVRLSLCAGLRSSVPLKPLGKPGDTPLAIDAGDGRTPFGQEFLTTKDFVLVLDPGTFGPHCRRSKTDDIVENRWPVILYVHLSDYQEEPSIFQFAVAVADRTEQLDSACFEPTGVVGVVHPSLAISFLIADAKFDLMKECHAANCTKLIEKFQIG